MRYIFMRIIFFMMSFINVDCYCIETIFWYEDGFYVTYDYQYFIPHGEYGLYSPFFPYQQASVPLAYGPPSQDGLYGPPLQGFQMQNYWSQAEVVSNEPFQEEQQFEVATNIPEFWPRAEMEENEHLEVLPFQMPTNESEYPVAETLLHSMQPNMLQSNPESECETQKEVSEHEIFVPDTITNKEPDMHCSLESSEDLAISMHLHNNEVEPEPGISCTSNSDANISASFKTEEIVERIKQTGIIMNVTGDTTIDESEDFDDDSIAFPTKSDLLNMSPAWKNDEFYERPLKWAFRYLEKTSLVREVIYEEEEFYYIEDELSELSESDELETSTTISEDDNDVHSNEKSDEINTEIDVSSSNHIGNEKCIGDVFESSPGCESTIDVNIETSDSSDKYEIVKSGNGEETIQAMKCKEEESEEDNKDLIKNETENLTNEILIQETKDDENKSFFGAEIILESVKNETKFEKSEI
ncbi:gelsolin-related protein of 125 kDa-like [Centruroides vittatus]|uniref:gelsolin-related protein of 125 kDa-like n=1 Tax=Centruroides vittatus TaxID=120091 RepID=UPI0035108251